MSLASTGTTLALSATDIKALAVSCLTQLPDKVKRKLRVK